MKIRLYILILASFLGLHNSLSAKENNYITSKTGTIEEIDSIVQLELNIMSIYATALSYDGLNNNSIFASGLMPKNMSYKPEPIDTIITKKNSRIKITAKPENNKKFDIFYKTNNCLLFNSIFQSKKITVFEKITIYNSNALKTDGQLDCTEENMKTDMTVVFTSFPKK